MRVLLVAESPARLELFANHLPPIGLLTIAATLEAAGHTVTVSDRALPGADLIDPDGFDLIGLSINCTNLRAALAYGAAMAARRPDRPILVGGPAPSAEPARFLAEPWVTAVVTGEGEATLGEYLRTGLRDPVAGMVGRGPDGQPRSAGVRPPLANLDALPFPALAQVPLDRYHVLLSRARPISTLITSRGCPVHCSFCHQYLGPGWRAQSPERVVTEIEWQHREFGVREFCVFDDNFSHDLDRAKRICRLLAARQLPVLLQTTNGLRVDRVDAELFGLMRRAGFWKVDFAPESGDPETLSRIGKGFAPDAAARAVDLARAAGLFTHVYFMLGFPWETRAAMERTVAFARNLPADLVQFSRVVPFPGTALARELAASGVAVSLDTDLPLFSGAPPFPLPDLDADGYIRLVRNSYRSLLYRPRRLARLTRVLPLRALIGLARYAIVTRNL